MNPNEKRQNDAVAGVSLKCRCCRGLVANLSRFLAFLSIRSLVSLHALKESTQSAFTRRSSLTAPLDPSLESPCGHLSKPHCPQCRSPLRIRLESFRCVRSTHACCDELRGIIGDLICFGKKHGAGCVIPDLELVHLGQ